MQWSCQQILDIVGGRLVGAGQATVLPQLVTGVSTDSRTLQSGDLFIPLRGPHYDGHDYLRQAVEHGAAACLSEEVVGGLPVPVIQVGNCLTALGQLARSVRRGFAGPVAAITGTSGKTSTKEMLASILSLREEGLRTLGNYNNLIGLPLTLCRLESAHRFMVLEMGMSAPGEIDQLARIAEPTLAIITNIGAGHLQGLGSVRGVARAKAELLAHLKPGSLALLNADDPELMRLTLPAGVIRQTFGLGATADVRATDLRPGRAMQFCLHCPAGSVELTLPLPGRHQVYNALAAAAAALHLGRDLEEVVAGLQRVRMAAARLEVRELSDGTTLLDDSYNANPQSMQAALEVLHSWPCRGRRIAVLADMLELGEAAAGCHEDVGAFAAARVDYLLALGNYREALLGGAARAGLALDCCLACDSHDAMARWLAEQVRPDDCVLVKGSRGMRMETVVEFLLRQAGKVA
ncbi:MAG: UDP-N-acetylmuramoyl-tripeptide--D-alanyl-D-alanine ligase [Desulfuromonas thiophila]|nr:UDP-N-acetylmuramoyl-tripeptide--D-alanyl-D-alanine ligase [Desulfuromonas thiophila]